MLKLREMYERALRRDEGATAVEYGIMVALIAAVIIAVVVVIGSQVKEGFCSTASNLERVSPVITTAPSDC
jgi:pilus assembly protein Flp/PilA